MIIIMHMPWHIYMSLRYKPSGGKSNRHPRPRVLGCEAVNYNVGGEAVVGIVRALPACVVKAESRVAPDLLRMPTACSQSASELELELSRAQLLAMAGPWAGHVHASGPKPIWCSIPRPAGRQNTARAPIQNTYSY